MPTIEQRLKELDSVDDTGLMMGYHFLMTPRRKRSRARKVARKPAAKCKVSRPSHKMAPAKGS